MPYIDTDTEPVTQDSLDKQNRDLLDAKIRLLEAHLENLLELRTQWTILRDTNDGTLDSTAIQSKIHEFTYKSSNAGIELDYLKEDRAKL